MGGDMGKLLQFVGADKVENITKSNYAKAIKLTEDRRNSENK